MGNVEGICTPDARDNVSHTPSLQLSIYTPDGKKLTLIVHLPPRLRIRNQRCILGPYRAQASLLRGIRVPSYAVVLSYRRIASDYFLLSGSTVSKHEAEKGSPPYPSYSQIIQSRN